MDKEYIKMLKETTDFTNVQIKDILDTSRRDIKLKRVIENNTI